MADPQHGAVPADGDQQVELAVLDALPQGGVVQGTVGGFQAVLFEVTH